MNNLRTVNLEKHLVVDIEENDKFTFQLIPEISENQELICRWEGEELLYALMADDQPGGHEHDFYWEGMEKALITESSNYSVKCMQSGEYLTKDKEKITFRIYRHKDGDALQNHVYHLISSSSIAYWFITIVMDLSDVFVINDEIRKIVSTARIT